MPNHVPVVTAPNSSVRPNQIKAASSLFSVTDADGDAMTVYRFWDSSGGGYFTVGGVTQAAGANIDVSAANLSTVNYVGGAAAGSETEWIQVFDGTDWSAWRSWTMATVNSAPVVTAPNGGVTVNTAVAASTLFSVTDADGDAITQYRFWDPSGGGRFTVGGVTQASNTNIDVSAANLSTVNYVGGPTAGNETEWVQVYDGTAWSAWQSWNMATQRSGNSLPVVSAPPRTVLENQWVLASDLFSISDADGDPMTQYLFQDNTVTSGSGYFWVNGATPAAGSLITVAASDLSKVWIRGGANAGVDSFQVSANDGYGWSNWANFNLTSRLSNQAPVATAPNASVRPNQVVAASTLFSVSDADGDPITNYRFWDPSGGGNFTVGGVTQASNANIDVSAANLSTVNYVGGAAAGSEIEWMQVYDGMTWSAWQSWNMATVNHAPVVTAPSSGVAVNSSVAVSSLFSVTDAEGDAITQYRFWDSAGGGYFSVNGVQQQAQQNITVSAANLGTVSYVGGTAPGSETEWMQAYDGYEWSAWQSWNMATQRGNNALPVVSAPGRNVEQNQWIRASDLFTVSDADGDPMMQYQFQDNNAASGSGYIWVNGATPAAGSPITVAASDLSTVWMRGGANLGVDGLQIRANDGIGWSNWTNFNLTTRLPNNPPVATVTAPTNSVVVNTTAPVSNYFSASDPDGDAITQYRFWDPAGGANITVNGVVQTPGQDITVTAANLGTVSYLGGSTPGNEVEYVRAFDGTDWSQWATFRLTTASPDMAGQTSATARNVGSLSVAQTQTFNDWVGTQDSADWYKFTLPTATSDLHLALILNTPPGNFGDSVRAQLYDASGQNALGSSLSVTAQGTGSTDRALAAGSYFVQVTPLTASSNYQLQLTQQS